MNAKIHACALAAAACLACDGATLTPTLRQIRAVDGFATPESVHFDARSRTWFVSNVGAQGAPGDGFISQLDARGELLERELVAGLNDPKGLAVHRGTLYVADVDALVRVDLRAPDAPERIAAPGALFLNDVAVDARSGDVYVSDSFADSLYRLRGDEISRVLQSPALEAPNGLLVERGALYVASIGPDLDPSTFETSAPGGLLRVQLESGRITPVTERFGLLDGLERFGSGHFVSDFAAGVYWVDRRGDATLVLDNAAEGLGSSADIGVAPSLRLLAVPELTGTRVLFYEIELLPEP